MWKIFPVKCQTIQKNLHRKHRLRKWKCICTNHFIKLLSLFSVFFFFRFFCFVFFHFSALIDYILLNFIARDFSLALFVQFSSRMRPIYRYHLFWRVYVQYLPDQQGFMVNVHKSSFALKPWSFSLKQQWK